MQELVDTKGAARLIGVAPKTIAAWRIRGEGPKYVKAGPRRIMYQMSDLEAWIAAQKRVSTSDPGELTKRAA